MPMLLFRQPSTGSLSAIVDKSQRYPLQTPLQYNLQLRNNQLEIILVPKNPESSKGFRDLDTDSQEALNTIKRSPNISLKNLETNKSLKNGLNTSLNPLEVLKHHPSSSDEGFESDLDSISLISCENESFIEKPPAKHGLAETDSANGGSGTDSESEGDKANTLTQKNVSLIRETFEKQIKNQTNPKLKESYNLSDCVCYTDVTHPDILIFVIKNEALVFKFENLLNLKSFYKNFSTLKAISNQKTYNINKNQNMQKFNLLQRTDVNGVTHIEIKKQNSQENLLTKSTYFDEVDSGPSSIISIDAPHIKKCVNEEVKTEKNNFVNNENLVIKGEKFLPEDKIFPNTKFKEFRPRSTELQLLNDVKFNTINNKVGQKKMITRSSSIENILNLDSKESNLVNDDFRKLRKVWNSAEDLLASDVPKRPERRKKKKPAPQPPQSSHFPPETNEDVFSGQFVRVNVNIDKNNVDKNRLIVKSAQNESHPKKLSQNFNILSTTKSNFGSFLKSTSSRSNSTQNNLQFSRFVPSLDVQKAKDSVQNFNSNTLNRPSSRTPLYEKNSSWTNSVPRILKKSSRSRSETRPTPNFQPMAYRYIDTTLDSNNKTNKTFSPTLQSNAMFLNATGLKPKISNNEAFQPRLSYGYNVTNLPNNRSFPKTNNSNISNRVFGLSPKLRDFTKEEKLKMSQKWSSETDLKHLGNDGDKNLKSSIKNYDNGTNKKKNEKKVTFSAYTTVQVV